MEHKNHVKPECPQKVEKKLTPVPTNQYVETTNHVETHTDTQTHARTHQKAWYLFSIKFISSLTGIYPSNFDFKLMAQKTKSQTETQSSLNFILKHISIDLAFKRN